MFLTGETFRDRTVKELESLKGMLVKANGDTGRGDEISITKSQTSIFSANNDHKSAHTEVKSQVGQNGKLFSKLSQKIDLLKNKEEEPKAAIETEIEIPSKGIHHVLKNEGNLEIMREPPEENNSEPKITSNGIDKMNIFSKIKYTPKDMADYIFWTGDEKGVAWTIVEFLQEGLMSRQEAINFLQSVKYSLDLMQSHYQGLEKAYKKVPDKGRTNVKRKTFSNKKVESAQESLYDDHRSKGKLMEIDLLKSGSPEVMLPDGNEKYSSFVNELNATNGYFNEKDYPEQTNANYSKLQIMAKTSESMSGNDNYDEILDQLRGSSFLRKEFSLEEVIFELAKIMFSESLTKGNVEAQKAMKRFLVFLINEAERGQISKHLQRKILDILLTAFMDALSEYPELLNKSVDELQIVLDQNSSTSDALRQLLMLGTRLFSDQSNNKGLSEKILLLKRKKISKELI